MNINIIINCLVVLVVALMSSCSLPVGSGGGVAKHSSTERDIAIKIDKSRKAVGLESTKYHSGMADLARNHSEYLVKQYLQRGKLSLNHDRLQRRASKLMLDYEMSNIAENVAVVRGEDERVAELFASNWTNSRDYKNSIFRKWSDTGVGVAFAPDGSFIATQLFGLQSENVFQP